MSRCFPYPPPSYRREDESVVESIKKEGKKSRERRKERRREKKEKREKSWEEYGNLEHRVHSHKKRKYDERNKLHEKDGYQKAGKDVIEQLEKSGLTEEHGVPCSIQEPCESLDSTQNSSKSRKLDATDAGRGSHGSTILRFRLPLQKHKEPEPTSTNEEPCFSGRVIDAPTEQEPAESTHGQSSSGRSSSSRKRSQEMERQFRDLIANWNPEPLLLEESDICCDDQGWLFGTSRRQHENPGAKPLGVSVISDDLGHGSAVSSLQPRACYLPEFDMYQLPYTIPF